MEMHPLVVHLKVAASVDDEAEAAVVAIEMTLLLVDDDRPFLSRLTRAMDARGFQVTAAESVAEGLAQIRKSAPAFAVIDMRLQDGNGLDVISELKALRPDVDYSFVLRQKGMFSLLPLNTAQIQRLRDEHHIYLPGDGRINVAGISRRNVEYVAQSLAAVI
jgi:CheY-like chemotaxis protein